MNCAKFPCQSLTDKSGLLCKYCEIFYGSSSLFLHSTAQELTLGHITPKHLTHNDSKNHRFIVERYTLYKTDMNVYKQLKIPGMSLEKEK